jgi:ankyrin repeat protein
MEASANGNEGCVQLLLEAGATVNDTEVSLEPAFTQAHATCASKPWASPSSAIASHQVDGWAALHFAAYNGRLAIAKRLLQGGAEPSTRNKDGKTALDYARERGNSEVVALLAC